MNYWLMKSEPEVYSLSHLQKDKKTWWEGVRNYQARNFMMKDMSVGDLVLFYHSNAEPSGIAGLARISHKAMPDLSQFDKKGDHFEPKSSADKPIWFCVEVEFVKIFSKFISLAEIKEHKGLKKMFVIQKGSRLSIQPVQAAEFKIIQELGK